MEAGFELRTYTCISYEKRANPCISIPALFLPINGTAEETVSLMFIPVLSFGSDSQRGNLDSLQYCRGTGAPLGTSILEYPMGSGLGGASAGRRSVVPSTNSRRSLDLLLALLSRGCVFLLFQTLPSLLKARLSLLTSGIPSEVFSAGPLRESVYHLPWRQFGPFPLCVL